jgi:hypothetical protein
LQNSLIYFAHLSHGLETPASQAGQGVAMVVGRLATSMFRFVRGASDDAEAAEIIALLDQLPALAAPAAVREDIAALRARMAA